MTPAMAATAPLAIRVMPKARRWRYSHGLIRRCIPGRGGYATTREDLSERRCRWLRSSAASRSCSLQEPQIERREQQDNSDVYDQALPEQMPEEQDVRTDHDGYQREHVKHDACLPSHRSTLLLEDRVAVMDDAAVGSVSRFPPIDRWGSDRRSPEVALCDVEDEGEAIFDALQLVVIEMANMFA